MSATNVKKTMQDAKSLRSSWAHMVVHCAVYLLRCGVLAALAAIVIVQPLFFNVYLKLPIIRDLSEPMLFIVTFAFFCHAVPYIVFNSFFLFMDSLHPDVGTNPLRNIAPVAALGRYFAQFKLPRRATQWPSAQLKWQTVIKAFIDQYLIVPVALYVFLFTFNHQTDIPPRTRYISGFSPAEVAYYAYAADGLKKGLLAFAKLVPHFIIANLINEVLFFTAHGTLHSNATLYRWFHKKHHEYTGTIGIAAEYATPLEEICANGIPTILYFAYAFFHFSPEMEASAGWYVHAARVWPMFITWMWARLWETFEVHSGYCFSDTWLGRLGFLHGYRARFHDYHHTHNVGNYGAGILMDMLCNTMDSYAVFESNRITAATREIQGGESEQKEKTE